MGASGQDAARQGRPSVAARKLLMRVGLEQMTLGLNSPASLPCRSTICPPASLVMIKASRDVPRRQGVVEEQVNSPRRGVGHAQAGRAHHAHTVHSGPKGAQHINGQRRLFVHVTQGRN